MDVIHLTFGVAGQPVRQKGFDAAHGQRCGRVLQRNQALPCRIRQTQRLGTGGGGSLLLLVPRIQIGKQRLGGNAEHHPVDRLHFNGGAVYVAHLRQTPPRRVGAALFLGQTGLQFFPIGFGGGKAVVAVPHCQHHRGLPRGIVPARGKGVRVSKRRQGGVHTRNQLRRFHRPAAQPSAAQHQLAVIQKRQAVLAVPDGFDQRGVFIVRQHHNVGRFQLGAAAHPQPGRDTLHHRCLARADGRLRAGGVVVAFQVDFAHQTLPHGAVHLGALHIHIAVYGAGQHLFAVLAHGGADALQAGLLLRSAEVRLRQHDMQRAGFSGGQRFGALPILRLGGELIHGNARPAVQRDSFGRQQNISGRKTRKRHHQHIPSVKLPRQHRTIPA